ASLRLAQRELGLVPLRDVLDMVHDVVGTNRNQRHGKPANLPGPVAVIGLELLHGAFGETAAQRVDEVAVVLLQSPRATPEMELGRGRANALERRLVERNELEIVSGPPPDIGGSRQILEMRLEQALVESAAEDLLQRILRPLGPLQLGAHDGTALRCSGDASLLEPGHPTHDARPRARRRATPARDAAAAFMDNTGRAVSAA